MRAIANTIMANIMTIFFVLSMVNIMTIFFFGAALAAGFLVGAFIATGFFVLTDLEDLLFSAFFFGVAFFST